MNILDKIVARKKEEVSRRKELYPLKLLEKSIFYQTPPVSLRKYLLRPDKSGVIAEFKRRSPSRGDINPYAGVERVSIGYMQSGASALSVLTDTHFFGGKNQDLTTARKFNFCPILRKDFIIDEYQVHEARSIGADVILLIAACLEKKALHKLAKVARELDLEVLMEIHERSELDKYCEEVDIIGVNNRNLKDFSVNIDASKALLPLIPEDVVPITESGISDPATVVDLKNAGFKGFLIGEHFMSSPDPAKTCREFIQKIQLLEGQAEETTIQNQ